MTANSGQTPGLPGIFLPAIGSINGVAALLTAAITAFQVFRAARDAWQAANPGTPLPPELTDEVLVADLRADSLALIEKAIRLQTKFAGQ